MKVAINIKGCFAIDKRSLMRACIKTLKTEGVRRDAVLSISVVSEAMIREFNRKYLGKEEPTDVMAFIMDEDSSDGLLLGDVLICPEVIEQRKGQYDVEEGKELEFVAVHGVLHLLGYDDDDLESMLRMDNIQRQILGLSGRGTP